MGMRKHDAQPTPDTMTRERDHAPVDGSTPDDRPLLARCQSCRREIRIAAAPGSVWKHTAAPRPPRAAQPQAPNPAALTTRTNPARQRRDAQQTATTRDQPCSPPTPNPPPARPHGPTSS